MSYLSHSTELIDPVNNIINQDLQWVKKILQSPPHYRLIDKTLDPDCYQKINVVSDQG